MSKETQRALRNGAGAILIISLFLLGRTAIDPWLGEHHPFGLMFGGIALVVWFAGWRPAILAALVGLLGASFLFVEPRGSLLPRGMTTIVSIIPYVISCTAIITFGEGMRRARRRAELVSERLRQSEETLKENARRKDEFLATLAHELRNPLAPMLNALQYLRLRVAEDTEFHEMRAALERQVHHMARLVDDLLDLARINHGRIHLQKETVDVATVIQSAIESTSVQINAASHELVVTLPPTPIHVHADPTRLTQVFINLLHNAAKFTPAGGRISVALSASASVIEVSIRDTGVGIEPGMLTDIFAMFTQADSSLERSHGGLGIGLTLANHLVTLHGGQLEAHSEGRNQGSEFIVRLTPSLHVPAASSPPQELLTARRPRRVLLIDDNREAARGLSLLLKAAGHETRVEHDGPSGIEAAANFRPEIILSDIGLPNLNGYEVARRIRMTDIGADCVLIAITGWGKDEDKARAMAAGFDLHFTKPVHPLSLVALIDGTPQNLCMTIPQRLARLHTGEASRDSHIDEKQLSTSEKERESVPSSSPTVAAPAKIESQEAQFLALADHDLRRAIHGIGMLIEWMRVQRNDPKACRLFDYLQTSTACTENLMLGLLEVYKLEIGSTAVSITSTPLSPIFEALRRAEEPSAQSKGLTLRFDFSALAVRSDPRILLGLLRNLVSQIIRDVVRGEVRVAAKKREGTIHIGVHAPIVLFPMEDEAPANRLRNTEAVTAPAFPSREQELALTLFIVEEYARLLGHQIRASKCGSGTCFEIEIRAAVSATIDSLASAFPWEAESSLGLVRA